MIKCPQCDEWFDSISDANDHFERTHSGGMYKPSSVEGRSLKAACDNCGAILERTSSSLSQAVNHFCSRDCAAEYGSSSSDDSYGVIYQENRPKIISRDKEECQGCGLNREEHRREHNQDLHAHHITPLKEFSDPAEAHGLDNLVTLCIRCHRKRHPSLSIMNEKETINQPSESKRQHTAEVYVESKDDIVEKRTDDRGRITLGTKYGNKRVQIAILEVEDDD